MEDRHIAAARLTGRRCPSAGPAGKAWNRAGRSGISATAGRAGKAWNCATRAGKAWNYATRAGKAWNCARVHTPS
jgi:hypothetical protein